MSIRLVTPPQVEPVTFTEAKLHCRIDDDMDAEDTLLERMIKAAREYAEGFQNRVYITQTWQLRLDSWPRSKTITLPNPPLQSVSAITYTLSDGTIETLDASKYVVDPVSEPGKVVLKANESWPTSDLQEAGAISVEFVAGYGDLPTEVPESVKQAILLLVGHWYVNRETVLVGSISKQIEFSFEALLWPDRMVSA